MNPTNNSNSAVDQSTFSICSHCNQVNRVSLDPTLPKMSVCGKCKSPLPFHDGITDVDSSAAIHKLSQKLSLPVIVDFWAPWCQPCLRFTPVFQQAARDLAGRAVLVKLNTQAHSDAGGFFRIQGIPTLLAFKNGIETARISGSMPASQFSSWLESVLV